MFSGLSSSSFAQAWSNDSIARRTEIHDAGRRRLGGRHDRACVPFHRSRRQSLHAGICVPRLSVRRGQRRFGVRHHQSLFRAQRRADAARDRRQAELQYGAGQAGDAALGFLGHRRHDGRTLDRARARLSGAQFRPGLHFFRASASPAHLGGDLRVRRQCAVGDVVLCRAAHLPRAARRRSGAVVRRSRLQFLHRHRRYRLSARHHPVQGICRAGMVCRPVADHRLGRIFWSFWAP